jgi:hypothetical protein
MAEYISEIAYIQENSLPVVRNDVVYEMINSSSPLRDEGFTLDMNFFNIHEELHGNLSLYAKTIEPNQDIYFGFIFRHAEPLEYSIRAELDDFLEDLIEDELAVNNTDTN